MTQQYGERTAPASQRSTPEVARDEAAEVARTATDKGGEVAGTVGEQATRVAQETKQQARNLLHEGRDQLSDQAKQGQQRAADGLHTLATQLRQMSEKGEEQGVASEVARQVADRTESAASWLEHRQPGDLVDEVRRFARRKPGVFLLGAALAGVAVGRLTRGAIAAQSDDSGSANRQSQARQTAPTQQAAPAQQYAPTQQYAPPPAAATPQHAAPTPYGTPTPEVPSYSAPPMPAEPRTWDPQTGPVNR